MSMNDLLEKFEQVKMKNTSRISGEDQQFCITHQEAYEFSLALYKKADTDFREAFAKQHEMMERINPCPSYESDNDVYMKRSGHVCSSKYHDSVKDCHKTFIARLVGHFESAYKVDLDRYEIEEQLMPQKPQYGWNADVEKIRAYEEEVQNLVLRYEDVVDQVIARLGGYTFAEKALEELKAKCWNAVHGGNNDKCGIVVKGRTIICGTQRWACDESGGKFKVMKEFYPVLEALAYNELGTFEVPSGISCFQYNTTRSQTIGFGWLEKADCMRFYKNGRLDLKFYTAADALAFAKTYLGYTSEVAA